MQNGIKWLISLFGIRRAPVVARSWAEVFDVNNPSSQDVLKDLAIYCNFVKSSFNQNPQQMAFNEGARDVFLHILEMAKIEHKQVVEICQTLHIKE